MESPPAPPSVRPDALDPFEASALVLLDASDAGVWDAVLNGIARAEQERALYPAPPLIDPSEGRRSSSELRRLIRAFTEPAPEPPPPRTRAGYALSDDAKVRPAFVAALPPQGSLRAVFPDLWAVDAELWEHLDRADLPSLARLWLESPGRRLVQDLRALGYAPAPDKLGASDLSRDRIARAAGADATHPDLPDWPDWRELHLAVPGDAVAQWAPHTDREPVVRALRLLEEGSPIGLRGAALAWLLNRAADDPFYAVDGIRRDLREDLPVRLSTAIAAWLGDDRSSSISRELETLSLQHAARIFAGDTSDDAARRAWSVARWLQRCLTISPFFGGDEEALVAHLRSLLPEPIAVPAGADALHPARFPIDGTGLDVAEVAFVGGVLAHYHREPARTLLPTPVPLVNALQKLASRLVGPAEEAADAMLAAGHNALGWPDGYPIAAPIAARKLMTNLRIGWVAHVGDDAQLDSIERFARDPRDNAWVAFAFHREAQHLGEGARRRAGEVFGALEKSGAAEPHVLATFGISAITNIDNAAVRILHLVSKGTSKEEQTWHPFVADALAGAAERLDGEVWAAAMERLLALMEDTHLDGKIRLNAALFALRRASSGKVADREGFLSRIGALAGKPPFSDHAGLRREVRRLGLAAPAAAGGKR